MSDTKRYSEATLMDFGVEVFTRLTVDGNIATRAVRSLLDASLMGIDTHGIEALDMYVTHIKAGGLKHHSIPLVRVAGHEAVRLWDMRQGFGLAGARVIMDATIEKARISGISMSSCRNANHIGACGVYAKMAADKGCIAMVSQQTMASLSPFLSVQPRIGTSPFAFVAPIKDSFPFYFDASMAGISRAKIKECMRKGLNLPEGVALDAEGNPTIDPTEAWNGQILPIGLHKGAGLAMVFEILAAVFSVNRFSDEIPSIVSNPELSASSSLFMIVIDPQSVGESSDFMNSMRQYVEYIESSTPHDPNNPSTYPGRREGQIWADRRTNGIPISREALMRLDDIAKSLDMKPLRDYQYNEAMK